MITKNVKKDNLAIKKPVNDRNNVVFYKKKIENQIQARSEQKRK